MGFFHINSHFCLMLQKKVNSSKIMRDTGMGMRKELLLTHVNSWHHEHQIRLPFAKPSLITSHQGTQATSFTFSHLQK